MPPTSEPRTSARAGGALHLIDPLRAGSLAVAALAAALEPGDAVICCGPHGATRLLAAWGVRAHARVPAPCAHAALARGAIRAVAGAMPPMRRVHAWSSRALLGALGALPRSAAVERSATIFDPPALGDPLAGLVRRALTSGAVRARFASAAVGRAWGCGLIDPAPALAPPASLLDRAACRAAWGAGPDDLVLGAITDPPFSLEAGRATFLVGVLAIAGAPARGVIPADSRGVERAFRMVDRQGARWGAALETEPPPRWLHACDAVIAFAPSLAPDATAEPPLCARWALDAGIPCVAEATSGEGSAGALHLVPPGSMQASARALAMLLGCTARAEGRPEPPRARARIHERAPASRR